MDLNTATNTENKIKTVSDEIIKMLIDKQVSYNDAQEVIRMVLKKIGKVEINSGSLKVF